MARQLTLLEVPPSWRLDDSIREAGRKGIAAARASLQAAMAATPSTEARPAERVRPREHPTHRRSAA
ncbi:MAG: hypothetical protein ABIY48_02975 [Acidimicrobiales bacterium]